MRFTFIVFFVLCVVQTSEHEDGQRRRERKVSLTNKQTSSSVHFPLSLVLVEASNLYLILYNILFNLDHTVSQIAEHMIIIEPIVNVHPSISQWLEHVFATPR